MEIVEKSPEMCSDRPGITPNTLDLEVSPTCLRETGRELLGGLGRVGGRRKGVGHISPRVAGPIVLRRRGPSTTSWRTVRLYKFRQLSTENCLCSSFPNTCGLSADPWRTVRALLVGTPPVYPKPTGCTDEPRTVRGPWADHPPL
jgi:hypothetical protein